MFLGLLGCSQKTSAKTENRQQTENKHKIPVVKDGEKNILYSWFDQNVPKTATDITKIPDKYKKSVRVQDLKIPPDRRDPSLIFIANLTYKNKDGSYKVKTLKRSDYEKKRHPETVAQSNRKDSTAIKLTKPVILYATHYCPHCKHARKWLLQNHIPFKEIDVDKNMPAVARLQKMGQEQGVSTSGVPMFEINGHLIPGFSPEAVLQALKAPPLQKSSKPAIPEQNRKLPSPANIPPISPSGSKII